MSPRITGPAVPLLSMVPASDRPLDRLRAAVAITEALGPRVVAQDEPGVERGACTGDWRADNERHPRRVSLAGAVCLALQPPHDPAEPEASDDAELAAAAALGVRWQWLAGALAGFANEDQRDFLDDELYRHGRRAGSVLFAELHTECDRCGAFIRPDDRHGCRA